MGGDDMRRWIVLGVLCLLAVMYPGADLQCWDTAGNRAGSWSETSCDGYAYSGTWKAFVDFGIEISYYFQLFQGTTWILHESEAFIGKTHTLIL
jgi:hypothetical protein